MSMLARSLVAMLVAAPMVAGQGQAREREAHSRTISYADLDLSQPGDAHRMLRRLRNAARDLCGERGGIIPLWERRDLRACEAEALAGAVAGLDAPTVTALYRESGGELPVRMASVESR